VTYDEMLVKIRSAVEAHNKTATAKLDADNIIAKLVALGGTSEDALAELTVDDLVACDVPRLMAKALLKSFAGPVPVGTSLAPGGAVPGSHGLGGMPAPAVMMDAASMYQGIAPRTLIEGYQIDNPGLIGAELNRRLDEVDRQRREGARVQRAFLVYVGGSLQVDPSVQRYELLLRGKRITDTVMVNDVPIRPLCVGEKFAVEVSSVNPLYPHRTLLDPDETCEYTHLSYKGVEPETRGILILAVQRHGLRADNPEIARHIILVAKGTTGLRDIRARYPLAASDWAALPEASRPPLEVMITPEMMASPEGDDPPWRHTSYERPAEGATRRPFLASAADLPSWNGQGPRVILLGAPGDTMVADIAKHLIVAKRAGRLQFWHAGMAKGSVRDSMIAMAETADVAVLVVSVDLLGALDEDPALAVIERRHAASEITVLPVMGHPVDLEDVRGSRHSTWFGGLVRIPRDRPPLSLWANKDDGFAITATEIGAAVKGVSPTPPPVPTVSGHADGRSLTRDEIMKIHAMAVRAGICGNRKLLLLGLPEEIKQSLPADAPSPSEKVLSDLHELARIVLLDGERPLTTWLRNAIAAKPYALETPFAGYIEALTGVPYRSASADLYASTQR